MFNDLNNVGAVVLAAGKGTRLGATEIPKVMYRIGGKPMVSFVVETLSSMGFAPRQICLVVGFCKEKVIDYFGDKVVYAVQEQQQGTAHAAYTGIKALPKEIEHVLVLGGDDSAFYRTSTLAMMIEKHKKAGAVLTLLSVRVEHPELLGRVVRHENGEVEIIEKEYVTPAQTLINEVSTGTFVFDRAWFEKIFPTMPQLRRLGEYGLPTTLAVARVAGMPYRIIQLEHPHEWFGINTPQELHDADARKTSEGSTGKSERDDVNTEQS